LSTRVLGARAEHLVAAHLASLGLEIVAMNVRVGRLEIDVVARDGPVIVVVEVRSRGPGAWVRPFDSVDREKRARVRRAGAQLWRNRFARDPSAERMRFDLASVDFAAEGEPRIEIVKAAF
jgi:putative endonuclease